MKKRNEKFISCILRLSLSLGLGVEYKRFDYDWDFMACFGAVSDIRIIILAKLSLPAMNKSKWIRIDRIINKNVEVLISKVTLISFLI